MDFVQACCPSVVGKTPLDCSVPFQFARNNEYFKNISFVAHDTELDALETLVNSLESNSISDPRMTQR